MKMNFVEYAVAVRIREHPNLYDKGHPDYADKDKDKIAYQMITRRIIIEAEPYKHTKGKVGFFNHFL